jgi:translation initiation factor IF-3
MKDNAKINNNIRSRTVVLIDGEGKNCGEMSTVDALNMAKRQGLDLVEVGYEKNIPICKILDFGKWKFDRSKKDKKKKVAKQLMKEIMLRPNISDNDISYRVKHAEEFLSKNHKVKVIVNFKGRERSHIDLGKNVFDKFLKSLKCEYKIETDIKLEGSSLVAILAR